MKKKTFFKGTNLLWATAVASLFALPLLFTACDDDLDLSNESIAGTWQCVKYAWYDGSDDTGSDTEDLGTITFNTDGTGYAKLGNADLFNGSFSYSISGKKLSFGEYSSIRQHHYSSKNLNRKEYIDEEENYTIKKLTSKELVIERIVGSGEDRYQGTWTFKKSVEEED